MAAATMDGTSVKVSFWGSVKRTETWVTSVAFGTHRSTISTRSNAKLLASAASAAVTVAGFSTRSRTIMSSASEYVCWKLVMESTRRTNVRRHALSVISPMTPSTFGSKTSPPLGTTTIIRLSSLAKVSSNWSRACLSGFSGAKKTRALGSKGQIWSIRAMDNATSATVSAN